MAGTVFLVNRRLEKRCPASGVVWVRDSRGKRSLGVLGEIGYTGARFSLASSRFTVARGDRLHCTITGGTLQGFSVLCIVRWVTVLREGGSKVGVEFTTDGDEPYRVLLRRIEQLKIAFAFFQRQRRAAHRRARRRRLQKFHTRCRK